MATRAPTPAERARWLALRVRMDATADPCALREIDILNNIGAGLNGAYLAKGSWTASDPQPLQRAQLLSRLMVLDVDWTAIDMTVGAYESVDDWWATQGIAMQLLITEALDAAGGGQANLTTITAPQMATGQMLTPSQVTTVVNHGKWQALQNFIYASDWVSAIAMLNLSPASEWERLTWTAYIFLRDRPASFVVQKEDLRRVNLYATLDLLITGTMNTLQSALGETYLHDHDLLSPNLATELRKYLTSFAGDNAANYHTSLIYCLRLVAPTPSTLVSAADLRKTQAYTLQASLRAVVGALTAVFGSCIGPKLSTRVTAVR